jgi:hypothetical protein
MLAGVRHRHRLPSPWQAIELCRGDSAVVVAVVFRFAPPEPDLRQIYGRSLFDTPQFLGLLMVDVFYGMAGAEMQGT